MLNVLHLTQKFSNLKIHNIATHIAVNLSFSQSIKNSELLFILNKNGLVGIRNISKELLKPQFNLITKK